MNDILQGALNIFVTLYLDNILILNYIIENTSITYIGFWTDFERTSYIQSLRIGFSDLYRSNTLDISFHKRECIQTLLRYISLETGQNIKICIVIVFLGV